MQRKKIVVNGFMAGCPIAGVVWQHIHYIVGLQRLGHDVYYIEDSARYPYNPVTWETLPDYTYAAETLAKLAAQYGFEGRWSFCARYMDPIETVGLSIERIRELYRDADAVLNVCGAQEMNEDLARSERQIYVESDPGLEQIEIDKGIQETIDYFRGQHAVFTFGEHVGTPKFAVPTHGIRWMPTRQPIVTDFWKTDGLLRTGAVFTSVANWNTSNLKDIEWRGDTYLWSKSLEFLKFAEAPKRVGETFELTTNLNDPALREQLMGNGWRLQDPDGVSIDHEIYRDYLHRSKGEFTVAKDQYVRLNTGWFSDRSACYLAAGRPVITQETGFTDLYGGGKGLLAFRNLDEVAEAVRAINADYAAHSRAAYEIAVECFEATKVLASLLNRAGI